MSKPLLLIFTEILLITSAYCQFSVEEMVVEYQETPIGLDEPAPRFSWQMFSETNKRGLLQQAYRLIVKDEAGNLVWDSGKNKSGESLNIAYQGVALAPETRYFWTVQVWDTRGNESTKASWFETGIMSPDPDLQGWGGAKWIGGTTEDLVLNAQAQTVFKGSYEVKLDEMSQSTKASFVFGANDLRLQNQYLNIMGVKRNHNESYLAFEFDISRVSAGGEAFLNVYSVGYTKDDSTEQPIFTYAIPREVVNPANAYDWHQVRFDMDFGKSLVYVDQTVLNEDPDRPPWQDVPGDSFNPLGDAGGDLIVYPALADIGFKTDAGQKASFKELIISNLRAPANPLFQEDLPPDYSGIFADRLTVENGAYQVGGKTAVLVTADPSKNAVPMLRSEFVLQKPVERARLYVTARGVYEMYLNGERVGNDYFNPGLTQYNETQMYQTYDVTNQLVSGENAVGALIGEGWWSGNITYRGYNWNYFGDRQSLLAKLVITYQDGSTDTVFTSPETWKYFNDGPIRYGSFFQGELYDSRKQSLVEGWSTASYDDSHWNSAVEVLLDHTTAFITEEFNYAGQQLIGQIGENASVVKTLIAQSVEEVRPGVYVYDMGQNMVGVPQIVVSGTEGDTITMRYAEMKYPDLPEHRGHAGMIMMENIRGARATDRWILGGDEEIIQPRFTFHGYRFLEVTGINKALPVSAVKGLVISSIHELASHYETSNTLVNKLWGNITWSFRSNFLSIPTDTPARNERMGWNGDINVFSKTATFLGDVEPFLRRHLLANRELQSAAGRFPDIAPIGGGFGGTLWGSSGVTVPWELYEQYRDLRLLEVHYNAMKAYVDFLKTREDVQGILQEGPLGDWLSPEGYKNDNSLIWTAYQVRDLEIVYRVAQLLGKTTDAEMYKDEYQRRKAFFNDTYVDKGTGKTIHSGFHGETYTILPEGGYHIEEGDLVDTQVSYAVPLVFNVFNERNRQKVVTNFAHTIGRENRDNMDKVRPIHTLMTGFIGTSAINPALSAIGRSDLAYAVLQQTAYPSWLYSVENGATTIWERLNSYTVEKGFDGNNSMNSFNHYSFGAVGSWMYNYSLGIQRGAPGFESFILQPTPDPTGEMTWAKGYYDSMYGRIKSEWKIDTDKIIYTLSVPANTTAELRLLVPENATITESGKKLKKASGVKYLRTEGGRAIYELQSGNYQFVVE